MEVDPWGPQRDDRRAAVQSLWMRGANFDEVRIDYPHVGDHNADSDDEDIINMLEADKLTAVR